MAAQLTAAPPTSLYGRRARAGCTWRARGRAMASTRTASSRRWTRSPPWVRLRTGLPAALHLLQLRSKERPPTSSWLAPAARPHAIRSALGLTLAPTAPTRLPCAPAGVASLPWVPRSVSPKIPLLDQAAMRLFDRFAGTAIKTGYLRLVLPNGAELVYGDRARSEAPVPKGALAWEAGWLSVLSCARSTTSWRVCSALHEYVSHCSNASAFPLQARSGGGGRRCAPRCACSAPPSSARSSPATTPVGGWVGGWVGGSCCAAVKAAPALRGSPCAVGSPSPDLDS